MPVERVARHVETDVTGQFDRQVFLLLRHHTAGLAMHDRDRRAPVALPGKTPVAQAELRHAVADALSLAEAIAASMASVPVASVSQ
jgi:hypothetical protein